MDLKSNIPLAERLRPTKLSQVVGQEQLTKSGKLLDQIAKSKHPTSIIFWGPPGSGKTTLARIIANEVNARFIELSAVSTGKKEVMQIIEEAKLHHRLGEFSVLFVDEIHRFNKAQQDAFLPYVENGTITLIGATTENPSFEVIPALLSRCQVLVLEPLKAEDIIKLLKTALKELRLSLDKVDADSLRQISALSGGDARTALNLLELSLRLAKDKVLSVEMVKQAAQRQLPLYDKAGESHYNLVSAFIKSLRGNNPTAAFYYLARMIQGGEDPKFIARRMVVFASEDIGLAAPAALNLAVSAFLAIERIGMPEGSYALYHCAAVLTKAPKSREVTLAMNRATEAAKEYPNLSVPLPLRNAPTKLMKDLGYNQGYDWRSNFVPESGFLPAEIADLDFFN